MELQISVCLGTLCQAEYCYRFKCYIPALPAHIWIKVSLLSPRPRVGLLFELEWPQTPHAASVLSLSLSWLASLSATPPVWGGRAASAWWTVTSLQVLWKSSTDAESLSGSLGQTCWSTCLLAADQQFYSTHDKERITVLVYCSPKQQFSTMTKKKFSLTL